MRQFLPSDKTLMTHPHEGCPSTTSNTLFLMALSKIRGPVHLRGDPIFWTGVAVGFKRKEKKERKSGGKRGKEKE